MNTICKPPSIYFYLPQPQWLDHIPEPFDNRWKEFGPGYYNWTINSYLQLKSHGCKCELVNNIEDRTGIIISHRHLLPDDFRVSPGQLLVCIKADWGRHPYAPIHICQNRTETTPKGTPLFHRIFWPGKTYFVHFWPQPNILPRSRDRKDELNTIAYFGRQQNLAPELQSDEWHTLLRTLDIEWKPVYDSKQWHNYRDIDAVIFYRDFKNRRHYNKPATKLYNSWLAGCVPICPSESAYIDECPDGRAAVFADSFDALKQAVIDLKNNPKQFSSVRMHGINRAPLYHHNHICEEWMHILKSIQFTDYPLYGAHGFTYRCFMSVRAFSSSLFRMFRKLKSFHVRHQ